MLAVPLTDYYEEVRRYLTCPEEVKDDLIYDVTRKVMDLNADRPDLDYNGILEFLGDPEDLANSLMEQLPPEVTQRFHDTQKKQRVRKSIAILSLVIVFAFFSSYTFLSRFKENTVYSNERSIIVTTTGNFQEGGNERGS